MLCQLSDEHSCLIWTTTPEDAKNLMKLSSESFVDAVNKAFVSYMISASYIVCL